MPDSRPLHPYEQSMLLVAMLFDGKNVKDVLSILPDNQSARMHSANEKFLKMQRNERMTEIVLELRRLLLVDEYPIDWIHKSWIDDALAREPSYLRPIISLALKHGSQKKGEQDSRSFVPMPVIFTMFVDQLIKTRQKIAIYDPVLMRLQSLSDDAQDDVLARLGFRVLAALQIHYGADRLKRFLNRRAVTDALPENAYNDANFLSDSSMRYVFVRELGKFNRDSLMSITQRAGLISIAMYLLPCKHHWQRAIILGFNRRYGITLEAIIHRRSNVVIDKTLHQHAANFIIASLEQAL